MRYRWAHVVIETCRLVVRENLLGILHPFRRPGLPYSRPEYRLKMFTPHPYFGWRHTPPALIHKIQKVDELSTVRLMSRFRGERPAYPTKHDLSLIAPEYLECTRAPSL